MDIDHNSVFFVAKHVLQEIAHRVRGSFCPRDFGMTSSHRVSWTFIPHGLGFRASTFL